MEEDIDIEEHDVLDNPRIRDIFPDLSRVKIELDSDDDDLQQLDNYSLNIKQEYPEDFIDPGISVENCENEPAQDIDDVAHGNTDLNDGVNDLIDGGSDAANGNKEFVPGNGVPYDDSPIQGNNLTDSNDDLIDGNSDAYSNNGNSHPNESHNGENYPNDVKSDPIEGNSDPPNDNYSSPIVISDSDVNDDNDFDSNNENVEGDDEAETSETDVQDDDSVKNNKNRYMILRKLLTESDNDFMPNKIIIGSKPSKKVGKEYQKAVVLLEDWGEKLRQNGCYCDQCEILFETPNALDHHKMSTHSFLVAVSHNVALKSTSKSTQNFARKSTSNINTQVNVARKSTSQIHNSNEYCNHCNLFFPDQHTLINHLYEVLPLKEYSCVLCKLKFNTQKKLDCHKLTHRMIPKIGIDVANIESGTQIPTFNSVENNSEEYHFKCKICHQTFDKYYSCKRHRKIKHPTSANKMIFAKIKVKTKSNMSNMVVVKSEPKMPIIKRMIETQDDRILIPRTTLFQCKNCKLHFLSGLKAVLHKECLIKSFWICSICNRRFRHEDKMLHKKQHEHNLRFRVYYIVSDLLHKILCRCPDCNLHFEENHFKAHFKKCSKIPSDECKTCNILVPKNRLIEHTKKHHYLKLKPRDFILIPYLSEKNLKRKISDDISDGPVKKLKLDNNFKDLELQNSLRGGKIKLYYCDTCRCCMKKTQAIHIDKTCNETTEGIACPDCGLQFTSKSIKIHSDMHRERKLTLKDFEIISLESNLPIVPPIPNYPQCGKCKIKFFRSSSRRRHMCGEDYEICNICGDRYYNDNLEAHLLFHDRPNDEVEIIPELLKKYEMLNAMWNILFHCNICNVLTDSYDKCVEHSQAHLNKQNITEQSIKCYICNMKFYESCWSKHTELHSRMKITDKDFKVLIFDPKKLLSESWLQIFESLPEKETNQIIDSSVYGHERGVKMKLQKPGRPEFTIYTCSNCNICIEQTNIQNHVAGACSTLEYVCEMCNIYFAEEYTLAKHEDLHAKGINKDEFRIVSFEVNRYNTNPKYSLHKCKRCGACVLNRSSIKKHTCPKRKVTCYCKLCKQSFVYQVMIKHEIRHQADPNFRAENIKIIPFNPNEELNKYRIKAGYKVVKTPKMFKQNKVLDTKVAIKKIGTKSETKIKIYKCIKCSVCVLLEIHLLNHVCPPPNKIFACKKCKQNFPSCTMPRHLTRHRNHSNFQAKNLKIINFSTKNNKIKFYKSESGATKEKLLIKPVNKTEDTSYNESTSKINLTKSSSKNNQNETPKSASIFYNGTGEPETDKKYVFYKCIDCKLCLSRKNHTKHRCRKANYRHYCGICDMDVYIRFRMNHQKDHEKDPELNSNNIEIIQFKIPDSKEKARESDLENESRIESDVEIKNESKIHYNETEFDQTDELITLHKCKDCKVCLCSISKSNIVRHQCVPRNKLGFCNICLEYFNFFLLKRHQKLHDERNLGADNFRIVPFKSRNPLPSKKQAFEKGDHVESSAENEIDNYENVKEEYDDRTEINLQEEDQERENIDDNDVENENNDGSHDESREIDIQDDDNVENKVKLYKCSNCKLCIHAKRSIERHKCPTKSYRFFCHICKQYFHKTIMLTHKLKHQEENQSRIKNLVATKIKIVKFRPLNVKVKRTTSWQRGEIPKRKIYKKDVKNTAEDVKISAKVFKCECGLHFTSEKTIQEHIEVCKTDVDISKENCSKCGLLFPTDILVSHLCKHHSKNIEIVVENYTKSLEHSDTEEPNDALMENSDTEKTQDNVRIDTENSIDTQNTTDTKNTLDTSETERSDINVDTKTLKTKKAKVKPDIYKCQDCNVYYMNQNTCYKHALYHEKLDPNCYIECKICGLQFTIMTLVTHMKMHHSGSRQFDLDKITVEIYYPVENSKPRKELYCAGDRLQSLLVSSSND